LLGSQSLGGRNYLGFSDPRFDSLLGRIREHRDFEPIRTLVHTLHNEFVNEVPFVPLWQLDQHIVLRTDVKPLPVVEWLDPLRPFSQIAQWQLGK
jgi:ABC-type oligopeptide transport system substrate-binding subunit